MLPIRDLNPTRRKPYVTWALIAINVAVFFLVQPRAFTSLDVDPTDNQTQNRFLYEHALVPCELSHLHVLTPSEVAECSGDARVVPSDTAFYPGKSVYLSLLASLFFHANLIHLLGNMWFLWIFGDNVEDRFGHVGYLALYLVGGIVASIGYVASTPNSLTPTLGASGAIAAVMGSYLVLHPRARIVTVILPLIFLPFLVPATVLLGFWFILQFFTEQSSGVAWVAHVVGFVFGAAVTLLLFRRGQRTTPAPTWPPQY
jgi:membrane associated rhomboid family serine protease